MTRRNGAARPGFTLIELLVVIAIIGVLMGLLLPALSGVRIRAKEADNSAQIRSIESGVNLFTSKMKVDYIPSHGGGSATGTPPNAFRLRARYFTSPTGTQVSRNSFEAGYLKQVFPQLPVDPTTGDILTGISAAQESDLDPNQTLTLFLTGSTLTNYQGFSNNKQQPFNPPSVGDTRVGPFLETKRTDFDASGTRLMDKFGTPYAYFSALSPTGRLDYGFNASTGVNQLSQSYTAADGTPTGTVFPYFTGTGTSVKHLNLKSFQISSAGRDRRFGNTSNNAAWAPGAGAHAQNTAGYDDFSNFHRVRLGVGE